MAKNNLTQKDIKLLIETQTKSLNKRLVPIEKLLQQNTQILRQTTALVTHLVQDVDDLKSDVGSVKNTVESHTVTMDAISKNTAISTAETAALRATIRRHEQWFLQLASKVRIKLEGLEPGEN